MSPLEIHSIAETFNPSIDHEQWMAFIVLNHLYPSLTYLSWDGYNCHGLADHSFKLMWQNDRIRNTETGCSIPAPDFLLSDKTTIVKWWTLALGMKL